MKLRFALKAITLFSALGFTLAAIYMLNTGHMSDFWTSLGFGQSGQSLNWCTDRLVKMESTAPSPWSLEEKDRQWIFTMAPDPGKTVEYLEIEKWLAKYCTVEIKVYKDPKMFDLHLQPIANVYFNDNTKAQIYRLDDQLFQINEVVFTSAEMKAAIDDLYALLQI